MENEPSSLHRALLKHRIVRLEGTISSEKICEIRELLLALEIQSQDTIKLLIHSAGGDTEVAFQLFDFIKLLQAPILGIVNGKCASAALIVLQACVKRIATEHSRFLWHSGTITAQFQLTEQWKSQLDSWVEWQQHIKETAEKILTSRTGKPLEMIKQLQKQGDACRSYLYAPQAKELGLIDEVIDSYSLLEKDASK
jgi:ATP-dependent protease ClpP protease subunit